MHIAQWRLVGDFARWLIDQHGDGSDVHERTAARFIAWRSQRSKYQNGSRIALARLLGIGTGNIGDLLIETQHQA